MLDRAVRRFAVAVLAIAVAGRAAVAQDKPPDAGGRRPYAPVGLFIGAIEEGARIFTPTRLLPLDHPEAAGHEFPTALQLHGPEFGVLVWLGARAGYRLWPTLQRYPTEPSATWPYTAFRAPPDSLALRTAPVTTRRASEAPVPGLRVVLFDGTEAIAFIVDTRGLSLAERGMQRVTAMGLDLTRGEFLTRLARAATRGGRSGFEVVVFAR